MLELSLKMSLCEGNIHIVTNSLVHLIPHHLFQNKMQNFSLHFQATAISAVGSHSWIKLQMKY